MINKLEVWRKNQKKTVDSFPESFILSWLQPGPQQQAVAKQEKGSTLVKKGSWFGSFIV